MFTTKKSQEQTLFWWVFAVAVLIVIIIVIQAIGKNLYPSGQQSTACRATIEAMDKEQGSIISYFVSGTKVPLQCETNWVGNLTMKKQAVDEQKEELLGQIVPLAKDCWYEFGEGKLDPFEARFASVERYCFVCSRFILPENFSSYITEDDLLDYVNSSKKYSSLSGAFPDDSPFLGSVDITVLPFYLGQDYNAVNSLSNSISDDYAVVFFGVKRELLDEIAGKAGLNSDYFGKSNYNVFILPYSEMGNIDCNELVKKKRTE